MLDKIPKLGLQNRSSEIGGKNLYLQRERERETHWATEIRYVREKERTGKTKLIEKAI